MPLIKALFMALREFLRQNHCLDFNIDSAVTTTGQIDANGVNTRFVRRISL
jgi:hypothetical protein